MTAICQAGIPVLAVVVVERGACPDDRVASCSASVGRGKAYAVAGAELKRQTIKVMSGVNDDMLLVV